jgi:hypothetical protein
VASGLAERWSLAAAVTNLGHRSRDGTGCRRRGARRVWRDPRVRWRMPDRAGVGRREAEWQRHLADRGRRPAKRPAPPDVRGAPAKPS